MDKPNPIPFFFFVVKKGRKIFDRVSGSIPVPVSETATASFSAQCDPVNIPPPGVEEQIDQDLFQLAPQGFFLDDLEGVLGVLSGLHLAEKVLYVPQIDLRRIIELVGDRSGKLAEGNQPVRGDALLFQFFGEGAQLTFAIPQFLLDLLSFRDLGFGCATARAARN